MLLDIFITHWTEAWEIGKKNFDMLALQRLLHWNNVRVTLVHDGSECFPEEYFAGYPYKVNQVSLPHGGIAKARNWCIDHAEAEWIKWCDFDDMFAGVDSVREIVHALEDSAGFDMLWFRFLFEMNGGLYEKTDREPVLLHGKVFRTSFLRDHNIRFQEYLTWCEDSAFVALIEMEIVPERVGMIKTNFPLYVYISRQGSLCNRPEILFDNRKSFFLRHQYVADQLRLHGQDKESDRFTVRTLGDSYITLVEIGTEDAGAYEEHERDVWEYFKAHKEEFLRVNQKDFDAVLGFVNQENKQHLKNGPVTKEKLTGWLKQLRIKYQEVIEDG